MMKLLFQINFILFFLMFWMLMIMMIPMNINLIHPINLGILLMILTMLNSFNMLMFINISWFSFLMFLIIIGGLLILFLYFTSFIMNFKNNYYLFQIINFLMKNLFFIFIIFIMFKLKYNYMYIYMNYFNEIKNFLMNYKFNMLNNNNLLSLMYLYNKPMNFITLMIMLYLFFCMTTIVKICLMNKKSIRKISNLSK